MCRTITPAKSVSPRAVLVNSLAGCLEQGALLFIDYGFGARSSIIRSAIPAR